MFRQDLLAHLLLVLVIRPVGFVSAWSTRGRPGGRSSWSRHWPSGRCPRGRGRSGLAADPGQPAGRRIGSRRVGLVAHRGVRCSSLLQPAGPPCSWRPPAGAPGAQGGRCPATFRPTRTPRSRISSTWTPARGQGERSRGRRTRPGSPVRRPGCAYASDRPEKGRLTLKRPIGDSLCHGSGHGWAKQEAPSETEGASDLRFYSSGGKI